jgi:hypothetical protein
MSVSWLLLAGQPPRHCVHAWIFLGRTMHPQIMCTQNKEKRKHNKPTELLLEIQPRYHILTCWLNQSTWWQALASCCRHFILLVSSQVDLWGWMVGVHLLHVGMLYLLVDQQLVTKIE